MLKNPTYSSLPSVLCFGEILVDMISTNTGNLTHSKGFLRKFGGAPANTACGLANLKIPVSFMGKVGNDPFGHFLKKQLESHGVETQSLIVSTSNKTTLAFVSLSETGERDFYFYKGSHESISEKEAVLPQDIFLFHFGSLTQTTTRNRKATTKLLREAKKRRIIISYDPNIREPLWDNLQTARTVILDTIKQVSMLKLNEEEAYILTGKKDIQSAVKILYTPSLDALFITRGEKGCYFKSGSTEYNLPAIRVNTIDTTGAGDAFNAGIISYLYTRRKRITQLIQPEILEMLKISLVISALVTTKKGAITAFPSQNVIRKMLKQL